ncbi:MAG: MFS transporter [Chloroflexota bacterium]
MSEVKKGIFYGWWIVLACALVHLYTGGTFFYGFTALFNPIVEEFGWSYALVSLAFSFRGFEAGVLAPIVGFLVDRLGPRKLLFAGVFIMGLGFLALSTIQHLWSFYVNFLLLALGLGLTSAVVTMSAVVRWFPGRMSFAMGFLTAGHAAGGLLVPAVVWLIDQFTWRKALLLFAAGEWLLVLPLVFLVKEPQEPAPVVEKEHVTKNKLDGLAARQVLRDRNFWLLSLAVFFGGIAGTAITVHQIPYMVSIGISRQAAGFMAVAFAIANITGRLGFGWLGEIMDKRRCFAISAALKGLGVLGFALANSTGQMVPSLIALGLGFGGVVPLRPTLQAEFFGRKAFGSIQGLLIMFITIGTMVAPLFAGWVFDLLGSYRPAFVALAAATFLAVPIVLAVSHKKQDLATA